MIVPLAIMCTEDRLIIHRNGKAEYMPMPFKPFAMLQADKFPEVKAPIRTLTKVPENVKRDYKKLEFDSVNELSDFKYQNKPRSRHFLANSAVEQLLISLPDFPLQYPHTNDLTVMFFDIETASMGDGLFTKPIKNPILCIGYSIWKYKSDGSKYKIGMNIIKGFDRKNMSDKAIVEQFISIIESEDPDIIVGYNSATYDWPYVLERAALNQLDTLPISRTNSPPRIIKNDVIIPGRIHFDAYNSNAGVVKDQTLFGIKDRTLKEMGRFYNVKDNKGKPIEDVELKEHIENLLKLFDENPDLLYAYLRDDIYRTEGVGNVYIRNCITLAERMHVPLQNIMLMYSSFIPKMMVGRYFNEAGLINTETNFSKYNFQNGLIARLGNKYEGALTGLYKDGLFDTSFKIDFSSMYPSATQTFNLGPDTTILVRAIRGPDKQFAGESDWTGQFSAKQEGIYNWYRVPTWFDKKARQFDLIVKVRNDKDGFLKKEIARLKEERVKVKNELNEAKENNKEDLIAALNSQQYALKVILNSIYGFLGLMSSIYGEMISAAMITGMCRWMTGKVIRRFRNELIELDTDGLILNKKPDEDEVNQWLSDIIKERFSITDNYMKMEVEEFGRSFFYAIKNYVVQEGDKLIIHGSSLKASRYSNVEDRARDLAIEHIFNNKPKEEVIHEAYDFSNCTLDDFVMRSNIRQELRQYDDQTCIQVFLAKQVEMKTQQVVTKGETISYAITKERLPFKEFKEFYKDGHNYTYVGYIDSLDQVDFDYYKDLIYKKLAIFGIDNVEQTKLDLGFQDKKRYANKLDTIPEDDI